MEQHRRQLETTWANPPGLVGWLSEVDHKAIARRFIVTAFAFFTLAGILAALMRIQLARPENGFLNPDLYNQVFTMHGTTMMFLFAVPVVLAIGIYMVPLMVGARAIALPRLLAYGYWMFLFGGIFLYVMFLANVGPDAGWFSYPPLAGPEYGYGKRADVWAQLITFTEVSALVVATCLICTILKFRTPGDVAQPDAAVRVGDAGHVVHGHFRHAGRHGLEHLPDPGSPPQYAFLQSGRRRRSAAVAAPVLVLRPPRGLHHLPAGPRDDVGDRGDVLAAAASSATSSWCCRWSRRRSSASASGSTTCSRPGCRSWGRASSPPRA